MNEYLEKQQEWSRRTFGYGQRTEGILQHIAKELDEIRAKPHDLSEWCDVIILAMDGFWRHGGQSDDLMMYLVAKQNKNFARKWPVPGAEDLPTEHIR